MAEERLPPEEISPFPAVRTIRGDAPVRWLKRGWADLRAAPVASLFYGVVLALMGVVIGRFIGQAAYELAFVTGFLLVGPFLAMGLYDISRRRERGETLRLASTLTAWRTNVPAIGFYALILALLMAVWIRVSVVVVALFFEGGASSSACHASLRSGGARQGSPHAESARHAASALLVPRHRVSFAPEVGGVEAAGHTASHAGAAIRMRRPEYRMPCRGQ